MALPSPVNLARRVMEDLVEYGHVQRPMLGVSMQSVAPEDAELYSLPSVSGALVQSVTEDGPAEQAGIRVQDVIIALEGQPVGYPGQLQQRVAQYHPGDRVTVTLYRDGQPIDIRVRLGEAPINDLTPPSNTREVVAEQRLGIQVEPITGENAERFRFQEPGGVVITSVQRASAAERRGLAPGHKILTINGREITDPENVRSILQGVEPGEIVSFRVLHSARPTAQVVNVRMPE